MQGIGAIVFGQRIFLSIQREFSIRDAISVSPHDGAEIRTLVEISIQLVETKNDIVQLTVLIRHPQRHDDSTIVDGTHFHPMRVRDGVELDILTVFGLTKRFLFNRMASLCNRRFCNAPVRNNADYEQSNNQRVLIVHRSPARAQDNVPEIINLSEICLGNACETTGSKPYGPHRATRMILAL